MSTASQGSRGSRRRWPGSSRRKAKEQLQSQLSEAQAEVARLQQQLSEAEARGSVGERAGAGAEPQIGEHYRHYGHIDAKVQVHAPIAGAAVSPWVRAPLLRQYWADAQDGKRVLVREGGEHKASWNELFYDLIFVGVVSAIGHEVREALEGMEILRFIVIFTAVWNIWLETSQYINRFDAEDMLHKLFFVVQMSAIVGVAIGARHALDDTGFTAFVVSMIAARAVFAVMYVRALRALPATRPPLLYSLAWSVLYIGVYASTLAIRAATPRLLIWLCIELYMLASQPLALVMRCYRKRPGVPKYHMVVLPLNIEHNTERFGLFTILAIGEIVTSSIPAPGRQVGLPYGIGVLGVFLAFALQWYYFDVDASKAYGTHALRAGGILRPWGNSWLHLIANGATVLVGALFGLLVQDAVHAADPALGEPLSDEARWAFCASVCVALLAIALIRLTHLGNFWTLVPRVHPLLCHRTLQAGARFLLPLALLALPLARPSGVVLAAVASGVALMLAGFEFSANRELLAAEAAEAPHAHGYQPVSTS